MPLRHALPIPLSRAVAASGWQGGLKSGSGGQARGLGWTFREGLKCTKNRHFPALQAMEAEALSDGDLYWPPPPWCARDSSPSHTICPTCPDSLQWAFLARQSRRVVLSHRTARPSGKAHTTGAERSVRASAFWRSPAARRTDNSVETSLPATGARPQRHPRSPDNPIRRRPRGRRSSQGSCRAVRGPAASPSRP